MRQLLLVSAFLIGLWPDAAHAQCPAAIPAPADATAVQCFTINKPVNVRCATAVSPSDCLTFNNQGLAAGLLTPDGYTYLVGIHFCAITFALPGQSPKIFDFCPEGCFAADTQVLSSVTREGRANYTRAASVAPNSQLLSLADDASPDAVAMAPHSVKRIVLGPEDGELFAFALANGRTLKVTTHHPMVLDSGKLVEASKVVAGDAFVGLDGRSVAVVRITRQEPEADVFNFETAATTQMGHIIVAEGVLTGDLKIQNELADEEGAVGLRR